MIRPISWVRALLSRRLAAGPIALPIWLVVFASAGMAAVAGQAVGPILAGSISGTFAIGAQQALVIDDVQVRDYPPTLVYSISPRDNYLRTLDTTTTVVTDSSVLIVPAGGTLTGDTLDGGNGIAIDPTDGTVFALLKVVGQTGRELAVIDPATGNATGIGDTGDRFAGLAFATDGTLYAVTGDGAGPSGGGPLAPESLYTLDKTTGAATFVMTLGNGNDGEAIAMNTDDGLIYHMSGDGVPNVNEIFEKIDSAFTTTTQVTLVGQDYTEATAMGYEGNNTFFVADLGRRLYRFNSEGFGEFEGVIDHDTKGLAPFGLAHVDGALAVINDEGTSTTVGIETHVSDTFMVILELNNLSDADANALLEVNVPEGMRVGPQFIGSYSGANVDRNAWILEVPNTLTPGEIRLVFKTDDDFKPGYAKIGIRLVQIEG